MSVVQRWRNPAVVHGMELWFGGISQIQSSLSIHRVLVPGPLTNAKLIIFKILIQHWKRPWCQERLRAGEGGDKRWEGWMASLTWWTWVCAAPGDSEGPGSLMYCSPWVRKESDLTYWLNNNNTAKWVLVFLGSTSVDSNSICGWLNLYRCNTQIGRMDCTLPEPGSTLWRTDLECENSKRTQLTILCFFPVAKGRG